MTNGDFQEKLKSFVINALIGLNDTFRNSEGHMLTLADKTSIIIAFAGIYTTDEKLVGRTFCLGFDDETSGRVVYQTVPTVDFHYSPFTMEIFDDHHAVVRCDLVRELAGYYTGPLEWRVTLGGNFLRNSNHHFNQFDRRMRLLPVTMIANPRTMCTEGCAGCSRLALGAHHDQKENYITAHVRQVEEDFRKKFPDQPLSDLRYVSVSTGCQANRAEELEMFVKLFQVYRQFGFSPEFLIFTNKIRRARVDMPRLHEEGATGYVSTVETVSDIMREKMWGAKKGDKTFVQHLRSLSRALEIFNMVEASMVFGLDEYDEMLDGVEILGRMGVSVIGNVFRIYSPAQLGMIHEDVWKIGVDYFFNTFEKLLRLNLKNKPSARYIRYLALGWMAERQQRYVRDIELPYKYRG